MELDCYPKYLQRNYLESPDEAAVLEKDYGIWNSHTWKQCYERVKYYSLGLVSMGLVHNDKVVIISDERPEAFWTLAAVQSARAIPTPVWPDSNSEELIYYINHCEAKFVCCEDQEQVDKVLDILDKIPNVKKVLFWDPRGLRSYDEPMLVSYRELVKMGREYEEEHPDFFEENLSKVTGDDVAVITYTSGTTGLPKGCMNYHSDVLYTTRGWWTRTPIGQNATVVSIIPPAHVFEQWVASPHYVDKAIMCFCEEPETMVGDFREIAPKALVLSPGQWISLCSTAQIKTEDSPWINRFIYRLFMPVGHRVTSTIMKREKVSLFWKALHFIGKWALFRALNDKLGMLKTKYPITGSAFTDSDVVRFFHALGIKLHQLYGLTETGVCTLHNPTDINPETIGVPCIGRSVRLSDEGEIIVSRRGGFRGYYNDPERTAEVIKNDWIFTGDAGIFTSEGHLVFTDRVKNLTQLKNGSKYAPVFIEGKLKFSPYIQETVAIGDENKDYISVMIIMDYNSVGNWAEDHHIGYTTFVDLSQKDEVSELINKDIKRVNRFLPEGTKIKKYILMHKEFDADDAELTRSRKTRPEIIRQRYADMIEAIYADKQEVPVVAEVKYRDGRTGTVSTNVKVRSI